MGFEEWIGQVEQCLVDTHPELTTKLLDADAMYQAWSNDVSPRAFARSPKLKLRASIDPPGEPEPVLHEPATPQPEHDFDLPSPTSQSTQRRLTVGSHLQGPGHPVLEDQKTEKALLANGFFLALCFFVLICIGVSMANLAKNVGKADPLANRTSLPQPAEVEVAPTPKKVTEAEKYDKARTIFASWKGDGAEFESGLSLLNEIPRGSKVYSEARALAQRWTKRKKDADLRKERERKQEEARNREAVRQAAIAAVKQEREDAKYFTGGSVKVAVSEVKLKRSTGSHVAYANSTYVYVYVAVMNDGRSTIHANPNDFTLADTDGNTASHESDTYSLGNYFDAVNLRPGQKTGGWLIFCMLKDKRYTLTRTGGFDGPDVIKPVIP